MMAVWVDDPSVGAKAYPGAMRLGLEEGRAGNGGGQELQRG